MDCQTCNDLFLDLAYGELDEVRAAAIRKHTETCSDCRQALRRVTRGRALAKQLAPVEPPPPSEALRAAIEAAAVQHAAAAGAGGRQIAIPASSVATGGGEVSPLRVHRGLGRMLERVGE